MKLKLTRLQRIFLQAMGTSRDVRPDEIASWMTNISGEHFTMQGAAAVASALARKGLLVSTRNRTGRITYTLTDAGRACSQEADR